MIQLIRLKGKQMKWFWGEDKNKSILERTHLHMTDILKKFQSKLYRVACFQILFFFCDMGRSAHSFSLLEVIGMTSEENLNQLFSL